MIADRKKLLRWYYMVISHITDFSAQLFSFHFTCDRGKKRRLHRSDLSSTTFPIEIVFFMHFK